MPAGYCESGPRPLSAIRHRRVRVLIVNANMGELRDGKVVAFHHLLPLL